MNLKSYGSLILENLNSRQINKSSKGFLVVWAFLSAFFKNFAKIGSKKPTFSDLAKA